MKEDVSDKIRGIIGLYNFYKYHMNTPQRVGLLTLWIEVSVSKEEYEVADVLQKELNKILNGEEEYFLTPPSNMTFIPTDTDNIKDKIWDVMGNSKNKSNFKPEKKLKWVNLWGTGKFKLIDISFNTFIIFNFGVEFS
jgi:hypothetical protein